MAFCLNMKSDFSFLSSTITFNSAINYAKANKSSHLSLIDNNLHGAYDFYEICLANNIIPLIGVCINVKYHDIVTPFYLISKNEVGYKNISYLYSTSTFNNGFVNFESLAMHSSNVILILSSYDSLLANYIYSNNIYEANELVSKVKDIFKDFYIGMYRYFNANPENLLAIKEFAKVNKIDCVCFQYANHINNDEKDVICLNLLDSIKNSKEANKEFLKNEAIVDAYLKNDAQLEKYYENDELFNLNKLANSTNLKLNKVNYSLPILFEDSNEKLKELAYEGLKNKGLDNNEEYVNRVNKELEVIFSMGFANYYLVVSDYVNYAKNNDIPVGPARGSGGASLVAYLINITSIDPIKYDLLFERFLSKERSNYPDFDVDFADIKRDDVISYVINKYGKDNVAYIATYATFGIKSAIRDLARIMKISSDDVDSLVKSISNNATSINEEYKTNPKFKSILDIHTNLKQLCFFAGKIEGLKKQVGLHAAGIIISKDKLIDLVPIFKTGENRIAICYDHLVAEKIGLIKMDFLGLKNLSIIDYALKKINEKYGYKLTINNLPLDDANTYKLLANCDTLGIFQLEGDGINKVIKDLKPANFNDVSALLALYRPGPMDMIKVYIERKESNSYEIKDEKLKDLLMPTYGVLVYQEQIMKLANIVASFSLAEADILRRAISKKKESLLKSLQEKFINGAINNGYSEKQANAIYAMIYKFADYGFNKSHSVGYGVITYAMAYIKANYPLIFYEALLNIGGESGEKKKKIFFEIKKKGYEIKAPDINESEIDFKAYDNYLSIGLANIASINEEVALKIIKERSKAKFNSVYDAFIRLANIDISINTLTDLNFVKAFDNLDSKRELIYQGIENLYHYALMFNGIEYIPNSFEDEKYAIEKPLLFFANNEFNYLHKEEELLGIYISKHPTRQYKDKSLGITDIYMMNEDGSYLIIGKLTYLEIKKTKDNNKYLIIRAEDDTGIISLRTYNNLEDYESFKRGDIVKAYLTKKNANYYLNKMEGCN